MNNSKRDEILTRLDQKVADIHERVINHGERLRTVEQRQAAARWHDWAVKLGIAGAFVWFGKLMATFWRG